MTIATILALAGWWIVCSVVSYRLFCDDWERLMGTINEYDKSYFSVLSVGGPAALLVAGTIWFAGRSIERSSRIDE